MGLELRTRVRFETALCERRTFNTNGRMEFPTFVVTRYSTVVAGAKETNEVNDVPYYPLPALFHGGCVVRNKRIIRIKTEMADSGRDKISFTQQIMHRFSKSFRQSMAPISLRHEVKPCRQ